MYIALPTVQKEMKLEPAQVQWVVAAYPLSSVSGFWFVFREFSGQFQPYFLFTLSIWTR